MRTFSSRLRRVPLLLATGAMGVASLTAVSVGSAGSAAADTAPPAGVPATVSADALPTAQINGVVWSQVVVGDTVYATGSFTKARPYGVAAGGAGEVNAGNIVAFSISTGVLTSFSHSLNAQGLGITASPDGSKVYVVGDFTSVDGVTRNHVAAFDTANGALDTKFLGSANAKVSAVTATASTVYIGGNFSQSNGKARNRLAALDATTGATSTWAPTADDNQVLALQVVPDGSRVIVGGKFATLNHVVASGLGAVSTATGATVAFAANSQVHNGGDSSGITSLTTDGTSIYGTGYVFGGVDRSLEGSFKADPDTGNIQWIADCHGDTYSGFASGAVYYAVSHAHDCSNIGSFPDLNPRTYHRAMAFTTAATGTVQTNHTAGYHNWGGNPAPSVLHWWPTTSTGTYTGQGQAGWSLTGNSKYVVIGGEFPKVNNVAQQGLTRFAISSIAPNKVFPTIPGNAVSPTISTTSGPSIANVGGKPKLTWVQTWDMDNANVTYEVYRDSGTTPVYSVTNASESWSLGSDTWTDSTVAAGTHTYKVRATDSFGNHWTTPVVSFTAN